MYLVMINCNLDDLPLHLTGSRSEAVAIAEAVTIDDWAIAHDMMGLTDRSGPICVSVVEFDSSGKPVGKTVVKDLHAEEFA